MKTQNNILDFLGISTSLICAVHCVLPPIIMSYTAMGSLTFLEGEAFEILILVTALIFAASSLLPSLKAHRNFGPLLLALFGFILIGAAHFSHGNSFEVAILLSGGVLLSLGHLWNWKLKSTGNFSTGSLS